MSRGNQEVSSFRQRAQVLRILGVALAASCTFDERALRATDAPVDSAGDRAGQGDQPNRDAADAPETDGRGDQGDNDAPIDPTADPPPPCADGGCSIGGKCTTSDDCAASVCTGGECRPATTCNNLKAAKSTLGDGLYMLDPSSGIGPEPPALAYCDMTFEGGGWTLYYSCLAAAPAPVSGIVMPGGSTYMVPGTVQKVAKLSTQVHIRTANMAATRSATSLSGTTPIMNLRSLTVLSSGFLLSDWTGPMTSGGYLSTPLPATGTYPGSSYWADGNSGGLHVKLGTSDCRWVFSAGNEDMELYVR